MGLGEKRVERGLKAKGGGGGGAAMAMVGKEGVRTEEEESEQILEREKRGYKGGKIEMKNLNPKKTGHPNSTEPNFKLVI